MTFFRIEDKKKPQITNRNLDFIFPNTKKKAPHYSDIIDHFEYIIERSRKKMCKRLEQSAGCLVKKRIIFAQALSILPTHSFAILVQNYPLCLTFTTFMYGNFAYYKMAWLGSVNNVSHFNSPQSIPAMTKKLWKIFYKIVVRFTFFLYVAAGKFLSILFFSLLLFQITLCVCHIMFHIG